MHQYLKAIGYGNFQSKQEINAFLTQIETQYSCHKLTSVENDLDFCEYQKKSGSGIGISVCGDLDVDENFTRQYYYPYFIGSGITSQADILIERRMDREAYVGICEDIKVGVSLIFSIINIADYLKEKQMGKTDISDASVTLSGLCNKGKILFPVMKNEEQKKQYQEESRNRMMLLSAAKNGDQSAIESLTLDDIDIYSKVSKRLITEDVFSIVDTYFMPYGVECDQYSIMGEILSIYKMNNEDTGEQMYQLKLDVNELQFDICVPVNEVLGEPALGRRFKGDIWLQGKINF